ncbi:hypothetical protein [Staphylococcus capitis]|uniref:hypothetical protein n=1 Tax=Staphylococcus capitis TaxID=29388 RepID=UPI003CFC22BF
MSVVIYSTPDGWRHTMVTKGGGQVCGRLSAVPVGADPDIAKDAATALVASLDASFFHLGLNVTWAPDSQPGWWNGTVFRANGEPI